MPESGFIERAAEALGFTKRAAVPTATLGSSEPDEGMGTIEAPDRKLNLIGAQRYRVYDEMVRDFSIVAAGVRLVLNLIANAVWTVNPPEGLNGNEEPVAQDYADQAYEALFGMTSSWTQVVKKIAMYRFIGFSVMEWTAKRNDDGTIGFLDIEHRPQRSIIRWQRDDSGTIKAVVQRVRGRDEVVIPRSKIVYAVDDTLTDHPEGMGLFRHIAASVDRLQMFLDLEEVGFTTDLRGIPVGRAPTTELMSKAKAAGPEGSEARAKAMAGRKKRLQPLREFLDKHVRNAKSGLLLPSDTFTSKSSDGSQTNSSIPKWGLELLTGDSTSFDSMAQAINRLNQEIARVLGVEHLMLGSDGSGSLALARSKVGTFYMTVTSTLQELVEIIDRDIMAPLAEMNGWPEELRPEMSVNEISDRDIEQIANVLQSLANAGATIAPDDPIIGEFRDLLGFSRPPEDGLAMDAALLATRPPAKDEIDPDEPLEDPETKAKVRKVRPRRAEAAARRRRRAAR